jgi:hypothetical protein
LAQNLTSVTASNIQKAGLPLATGTLCFTATDSSDSPIGFRIGGGGQEVVAPYCTQVTNGAISGLQVANPANTSPANISYRVEVFDSYARVLKYSGVQFTGATFNLDNYIPSANLPLGSSLNVLSVGSLTVTGGCTGCGGGGGGGGYSTIENAATSLTQRAILNWTADVVCSDNAGQSRSDCALAVLGAPGTYTKITTDTKGRVSAGATAKTIDLADFSPGAPSVSGKVPIWDQPSQSYIPGDPLVQGIVADGSTTAANPMAIGGYDTAGTPALHRAVALNASPAGAEYGLVTRNIPSGTQAVSGTVTANISGSIANTGFNVNNFPGTQAVSAAQLPAALDGSGFLKVHEQGTAAVSGTVTANAGTGSFTVAQATGSNLHMTCDSGCSSSAGFSDSAAFTTGTTAINPAGGLFDDTPPAAITTGKAAAVRITNNRALHINLRNQAGVEIATASAPMQVSLANTAANATAVKVDGSAVTQPVSGTITANQGGTWIVQPGNTANTTAWLTTDSADGNTASAVPAKAGYIGGSDGANLVGMYLDPCKRGPKTRFTINLAASGQIITGAASKKTYICDFDIVTATAQNIALVEGTGSVCATGIAGMAGGSTAATGWNFAANGGLVKGNGDAAVYSADSAAADNVCLLLSSTGQSSGSGHYVQF